MRFGSMYTDLANIKNVEQISHPNLINHKKTNHKSIKNTKKRFWPKTRGGGYKKWWNNLNPKVVAGNAEYFELITSIFN